MDQPVGGNSSARVPVNLACGNEFLSSGGFKEGAKGPCPPQDARGGI